MSEVWRGLKISYIGIFPPIRTFPQKELKNTMVCVSHLYRGFILNEVPSDNMQRRQVLSDDKLAQSSCPAPFKEMDF